MQTLVISSGTMGPSLALCLALTGHNTVLVARRSEALASAEGAIEIGYRELADAELLPAAADGWRGRLSFATDMAEAARNADFAFEAIAEDAEASRRCSRRSMTLRRRKRFSPAPHPACWSMSLPGTAPVRTVSRWPISPTHRI